MFKEGACPKCNSNNVFTSLRGAGWERQMYFKANDAGQKILEWRTYLCADCGYFENYVENKAYLDGIKNDPKKNGWDKI